MTIRAFSAPWLLSSPSSPASVITSRCAVVWPVVPAAT